MRRESMSKRIHAKRKSRPTTHGPGIPRMIPLIEIRPDPNNVRKQFDEDEIAELAGSIKENGVLQPILLRPVMPSKTSKTKYQIIAGERRYRAARLAGLKEILALVREMNDVEALGAQLVENLQRKDLHPLDEADSLLRLKELEKLGISDIAQRLAKPEQYVARRLSLTNLIEEARADLRKERITLAHALEICRLAPEMQAQALAACYENKIVFDRNKQTYTHPPDKTMPARHVRYLREYLMANVYLNLHRAPFKQDDGRLREDGLTCLDCPQRTGRDKTLFADIENDSTCLNPDCFQAKLQRFVQIKKADLDEKNGKPAAFISTWYGQGVKTKGALGKEQYELIEKKVGRCQFAEQAVFADGTEIGQVRWICREKTCKDHLGRVHEYHSHASGGPVSLHASSKDRNRRKQELFDIKVDEAVRKRVIREAIKAWSWPLDRADLHQAVKEFFQRIPSEHQRTICEVLGLENDAASKLRFDEEAVLRKLAELDDSEFARFLMLCSVAHYGANRYGSNRVDQSEIVRLSAERGVDYALFDAEVRLELCPKKYLAAHRTYHEAIKSGKAAGKPVVYEHPGPKQEQAEEVGSGKEAS
jgi:ParB/RepB/Spo0J family partition protein